MAIASDYRPQKFSDVVGQESVVAALKSIAKADGVTVRSILLYGSWGAGKTSLARIFGKAVNCENFKKTGDVCNECEGCKEAMKKNSQSYIEFDSTRTGSVDAIRNMDSVFSSGVNGRRVLVFDEIHTASKAAQSALLKVLEEGVKSTFMVFCTTDKVLDTIQSRSVVFNINTIPVFQIKQRVSQIAQIRGIEISDNELEALAIKSKGHMRDALSILEHYELAGSVALKTPLRSLKKFIFLSLKHEDIEDVLKDILSYPLVDIRSSVSVMIRDFYRSDEKFDKKVRELKLHHKIFEYFYSSLAQQALQDEYGTEILLRSFYEKIQK